MIEHIRLNASELDECQRIMARGNNKLKQLAEMVGMENIKFRVRLFKSPFAVAEWPELSEAQVVTFTEALPDILAVRAIEYKMLCAFCRLAHKMAKRWFTPNSSNPSLDISDYLQEALMALLDAVYGYSDPSTKFITYATTTIRNRLSKCTNKSHPLSPLSNEALGLIGRFEAARQALNGPATQTEIYEAAAFTPDEIAVYESARVMVFNQSVPLREEDSLPADNAYYAPISDYTEGRRGIDHETDTVPCYFEIREAMDKARLTPVERRIVETFVQPYYGWQSQLAKELLNPVTNQPMTRAGVGYILRKALDKIKAVYLKREVA